MQPRNAYTLLAVLLHCCGAQPCTDYDLRLVGGQVPNEGRVEICVNQEWGTVCDDSWGDIDARVVCRQLGYQPENADSFRLAHFGQGSGQIFLDDVSCSGVESRLIDCGHLPVGDHNCGHYEDAGVHCVPCQQGEIRLVGGTVDWEGRVEVCVNNDWSTVCDDHWATPDANVACRQLGYSRHDATAYTSAHFGQGNGPIGLDNVGCSGSELRLVDCSYDSHTSDCSHVEDAGVLCRPEFLCEDGAIRVASGPALNEGRVEVCFNETWGTVCNDLWQSVDAGVACRQLGFPSQNAVAYLSPTSTTYSQGTGPIFLDNVNCDGTESRLADCTYDSHTADCTHSEDAGIRCQSQCQVGDIRLAGSSIPGRGRVEVCVNGIWGTVCDDGWGPTDASVVCKQLNYSRHNATALSRARFGPGSIPILIRNVGCSGSEEQLTNCPFNSQTVSCSHSEDASVQCQTELICRNGDIRITGGTAGEPSTGRVEVCFNETWGTVCDDHWNQKDAIVACRQLGYSAQSAVALTTPGVSGYSQGTGPIFLDNLLCNGSESRLVDCPYDSHTADCRHSEDAGVRCEPTCQNGDIRLVGGGSQLEGRVEICLAGVWGTVCDDLWHNTDAAVVCQQLGFSHFGAVTSFSFRGGSGPIHLDNVQCSGSESRLLNCPYDSHTLDCSHAEDAGVLCRPITCSNGDIRLVGGLSEFEGRVEVCWNETWGTVCDDFWGVTDARVVCRQLGFDSATVGSFGSAHFGRGNGSIFLDDVGCSGSEQSLVNCSHRGIGNEDCGHHEDAGVRCGQCIENSVRLVGGSSQYEGRVEICLSGRWGTVCDDLWGDNDARVVCRQHGYQEQGSQALSSATFGQGTAPIIMNNVRCSGTESQLASCRYDGAPVQGCSHSEDAGVRCQNVPGSPQTVSVTSLNPSSLTVSWTPPPANQQFGPLLRYNVSCSAPGTTRLYETPNNTTFSRLVNGLHGCISYNCCVSAINAVGDGIKKCRSASTREDMPSAPPRSVAAYATSPTSLFVSWSVPLLEHRNGCIRQYRIYVVERDTGTTLTRLINTGTFQVTISSLHPYYQYECKVAAITTGEGPSSQTVTTRTYSSPPSGPPRNIIVSQTSRSISLEWNLPLIADRNGVITSYLIRVTDVQTSVISDYTTASTSYTVESLRPCTPYSVMIAARNVNGTGPFSGMHEVRTAEDVPSGPPQSLSLQTSNSSLHVSWSPPLSENCQIRHYKINVTELDTGMILLLNTTGTSITVPSLHPFYQYSSVVAAFTIGVGPYTSAQSIRIPEWKPSGPPQHLVVSGFSNNFVSLSWSSPRPEHRNGIITGYVVSVTLEDTGASYQLTSQTTQLTVESLVPNGLYAFAIAAQTSLGTGPFSMTIMQRTSPSLPSSPQDFTVTTVSNSSTTLRLSWSPPEFPNGDILGYTIRITVQQTGEQSEYTSTSLTLTVFQLHPYYTYNCKVAAFNSAGLGQFTTTVSQTTPQDIPGPPRGLTATPSCPPSITLNWSPPLLSERNGIITSYRIGARTVERVQMFQWTTSSTSYTIPDAAPYTTYIFQVAASTVAGQGVFSGGVDIKTCETHPTHAPLNITEEARGTTSFQISWSPPPDEHHNGIIRHYTVNVTETETGRRLPTFTTESTQITVTNLHPYYIYYCSVAAVTVAESPHSATIGVQTREAAPSGPPVNLNAITREQDPFSVYLEWSPPEPAQRNGVIRRYNISIIRADNTQEGSDLTSPVNSLNIGALRPFTTYRCKVAAYTVALGPYTAEYEITTPQAPPTAPPQGVSAEPQGPTILVINWQPPPVEHRNGIIVEYTVLVTEILTGTTRELPTGGTSIQITVSSLHPFYSYSCSVAATTVGRGPFSPNFTVVLPETSPGAPRNSRHTVLGGTSCQLTWEPPRAEDQNGIIRRYMIVLIEVNPGTRYELEADTTSKLLDFLRPFTEYQYKVAAVTVSIGDYTDLMDFTTLTIPPEAVRNLTIAKFEQDPTTIVLTWLPPLQANGVIQGYIVNVTGLTQPELSLTYLPTDTTFTVTSLHPYYLYQCAVAARTSAGSGPFNLQAVQLPEDVPSGPPLNLIGSPQSSRTLQLSWQAPLFEHQNGVIRRYRINVTELETGQILPQQTSTVTSINVQSLHPYYHYNCSVAAYTNGVGPYDSIIRQMPSDVPTSPPHTFVNESILPTSVTFSWDPPPPEDRNGLIVKYVIRAVVIDTGELFEVLTESNGTTLVYGQLQPDSAYNFSVAAMTDAVGTGPFTDNITVITPPDVPAAAPKIKPFLRISATSVRISWQPLTPEESRGVVSMYHVKYRPLERVTRRSLDDMSVVISTIDLEVTITDLDPRVTYAVAVAASTSAGIGNYSSETVVELFSNSLFQLHLTGAIICQEWLRDRHSEIFTDLAQDMARKLEGICNCGLSAKYIGDGRLHCNENRTGTVSLQARMISTESRDSISILSSLQQWVHTSPALVARGVQLTIMASCSVELAEFNSSLGCVQVTMVPQPTQQPTATQPTSPDLELGNENIEAKESSSIPIPAIAGAAGGILVVVIIIVILAVVVHKKRKSKGVFPLAGTNATALGPLPTGGLYMKPPISAAAAVDPSFETFLSTSTDEDHIYGPIPVGRAAPPATKYENQPLPIPQDSKVHEYDTTSHKPKPTRTAYDYAITGRRVTMLPEETSASSKANGYSVPRKIGDEPQKSSDAGEAYAKLDMDSLPPLQYSTFGQSGAVPNPYEELPTQTNPSYGQFGASDSSGSDSRPEGQEHSRNEEEYIEMH